MKDTKKIIFITILIALMFVFSWTPLGMVPLGIASATTIFLPVAIGIVVLKDFKSSLILGLFFGIVSFIRALVPQGLLDPYFQNPIVSVTPRILVGIALFLLLKPISKIKNKYVGASFIGGLAAFLNTIFTMTMLFGYYFKDIESLLLANDLGIGAWGLLLTILLTNMIPEIILGAVTTPLVMKAFNKISLNKEEA